MSLIYGNLALDNQALFNEFKDKALNLIWSPLREETAISFFKWIKEEDILSALVQYVDAMGLARWVIVKYFECLNLFTNEPFSKIFNTQEAYHSYFALKKQEIETLFL